MRLRHLLRERDVRDRGTEQILSVYRDHGVVPKIGRSDNFNKTPEDVSNYKLVLPGDLVVNKMKAWQGSIAVSEHHGIVSGDYLVCEVTGDVERRYLHHLLRSRPMVAEYAIRSSGIRPSQWRLYWDDLGDIPVDLPDLPQQQRIAEFLDTETARIDALITKKRRMIDLLYERRRSQTDALLSAERRVALRRVAELLPGYMFSSSDFSPDATGPRLLRGVNVGVGSLRWDDTVQLGADRPVPQRYRLALDDVVVGMDRPFIAGGTRVARVDEQGEGALLVQRVCRVRTPTLDAAILVEHVLRSTAFVAHVEPDLTGVSVPHLSDEQIGSMPVPVFGGRELKALASRLLNISARSELMAQHLENQIALLQEHRQALVTAAVTGELAVPGVAA